MFWRHTQTSEPVMERGCGLYLVKVLDYGPGEIPLVLDGRFYQLVEVIGTDLKRVQHPRERPTSVMKS